MPREATATDLPHIVAMGRKFHAASGMPMAFDAEAFGGFVNNMLASDTCCFFVTDGGMICGALSPAYCNPAWVMAVELMWWAEDGQGLGLLSAFEDWARDRGASEVRMTSLHALKPAERILSRRGYAPIELSHTKVI